VCLQVPLGDLHYHDTGSALPSHSVIMPIFQILGFIACTQSGWCAALPCLACYADRDLGLVFVIVQGCARCGHNFTSRARMVWSRLEDCAGVDSLDVTRIELTAWRPIDKRAGLVAGFGLTRV
jgi:hypothetical protein